MTDSIINFNKDGECILTDDQYKELLPKGLTQETVAEVDKFKSEVSEKLASEALKASKQFFESNKDFKGTTHTQIKFSDYSEFETSVSTDLKQVSSISTFANMENVLSKISEKSEEEID